MDGVTTALELEDGVPRIKRYLENRAGGAIIHYGASVRHQGLRLLGIAGIAERANPVLDAESIGAERTLEHVNLRRQANYTGVEDTEVVHAAIAAEIRAGGLGIGMAHQYYPGATHTEIFRVFELAAELDVPISTHVRDMAISAVQEVLANALATGASLHIVHLNSSSIHHLPITLALIKGARDAGLDVTTEAYPYTAASAGISSAIFDEGWQEKLRMTYEDIQWQDTGERLTEETFNFFQEEGGTVIFHMMDPEMIELAMRTPFVMVASDGMPYAPGAHPRSAGTFSRVLGRYVRDQGVLSLPDAIKKITLMPAERLQEIAPLMRRKGRIQIGAIADITVFDPDTIIDTANFEDDLTFAEGSRTWWWTASRWCGTARCWRASSRANRYSAAIPPSSGADHLAAAGRQTRFESVNASPRRFLLLQVREPGDPMAANEAFAFRRALGIESGQLQVFDLLEGARPCPASSPSTRCSSEGAGTIRWSGADPGLPGRSARWRASTSIPSRPSLPAGVSRRWPGRSAGAWSRTTPAPRWGCCPSI